MLGRILATFDQIGANKAENSSTFSNISVCGCGFKFETCAHLFSKVCFEVAQLCGMGFEAEQAKAALEACGSVEAALRTQMNDSE